MKINLSAHQFSSPTKLSIEWCPNYFGGKLKMLCVCIYKRQFILSFDFRKGDLSDWLKPRATPPAREP